MAGPRERCAPSGQRSPRREPLAQYPAARVSTTMRSQNRRAPASRPCRARAIQIGKQLHQIAREAIAERRGYDVSSRRYHRAADRADRRRGRAHDRPCERASSRARASAASGLEPRRLRQRHLSAEPGDPVIPPPLVVLAGTGRRSDSSIRPSSSMNLRCRYRLPGSSCMPRGDARRCPGRWRSRGARRRPATAAPGRRRGEAAAGPRRRGR